MWCRICCRNVFSRSRNLEKKNIKKKSVQFKKNDILRKGRLKDILVKLKTMD